MKIRRSPSLTLLDRGEKLLEALLPDRLRLPPANQRRTFALANLLALALLIFSSAAVVQVAGPMSAASLWVDEMGSHFDFANKGVLYVASHYPSPRNHIFYNALHAALPIPPLEQGENVHELTARALSFASTAAVLGIFVLLTVTSTAGRRLTWALAAFVWASSPAALELGLMARGYGLLNLLCLVNCLALLAALTSRRPPGDWPLLLMGLCTVLGAYTVPYYIIFGGLLLIGLWACTRRGRVFWVGLGTGLLCFLLYLPVLGQLWEQAASYAENFGKFYIGGHAVFTTLQDYFLPLPWWLLWPVSVGLFALPWVLWKTATPTARIARLLSLGSAGFITYCLYAQTPPLRATSLLVIPLGLLAGLLIERVARLLGSRLAVARPAFLLAIGLSAVLTLVAGMSSYVFVPYENWKGATRFLANALPPGGVIDISRNVQGMETYLPADRRIFVYQGETVLAEEFAAGVCAIAVAPWMSTAPGSRVPELLQTTRKNIKAAFPRAHELTFPGRFRNIHLFLRQPPGDSGRKVRENGELKIIPGTTRTRALIAVLPEVSTGPWAHTSADHPFLSYMTGGQEQSVSLEDCILAGNLLVVPLDDQPVTELRWRLNVLTDHSAIWLVPGPDSSS